MDDIEFAEHSTQAVAPVVLMYLPAVQALHSAVAELDANEPTVHVVQIPGD